MKRPCTCDIYPTCKFPQPVSYPVMKKSVFDCSQYLSSLVCKKYLLLINNYYKLSRSIYSYEVTVRGIIQLGNQRFEAIVRAICSQRQRSAHSLFSSAWQVVFTCPRLEARRRVAPQWAVIRPEWVRVWTAVRVRRVRLPAAVAAAVPAAASPASVPTWAGTRRPTGEAPTASLRSERIAALRTPRNSTVRSRHRRLQGRLISTTTIWSTVPFIEASCARLLTFSSTEDGLPAGRRFAVIHGTSTPLPPSHPLSLSLPLFCQETVR